MNCAYIDNTTGTILNIIVASPSDQVPDGFKLVEIPSDIIVNIGFTHDGSNFIDTEGNVVLPIPPEEDEVIV